MFGGIHREVRLRQDVLWIGAGAADRDADADGNRSVALRGEARGDLGLYACRQCVDFRLAAVEVFAPNDEFIAAEPRNGVGGAHQLGEAAGYRYQQVVTLAVSEFVVDGLEVVQVEKQHRDGALTSIRHRQGMGETVEQ